MFEVLDVKMQQGCAEVNVLSRQKSGQCPSCNLTTTRVHSYYYRKVQDLPGFENKVTLRLKARKFYCSNNDCQRKVFTERFDEHFGY